MKRLVLLLAALGWVLVTVSACGQLVGSIIMDANRQSDERAVERGKGLLAQHLQLIDKLRAEGDPMGDYLWARANADRIAPNPISDPLVLKKIYEEAVAKGSVDAQHVLGEMLITGSTTPSGFCTNCPVLDQEDSNPELGLKLIEQASAKQCFFWSVELDGMANRSCLVPVVTARFVWPNFRDGSRFFLQDAERAEHWRQIALSCQATLQKLPPTYFVHQKFPACR